MANALNLVQGPAQIFLGTFGAVVEPSTSGNFTGTDWTPTSGWTDLGFTNGGVTLNLQKEYSQLEVDQLTMSPHSVVVSESVSITTTMAEITLENLVLSMNDGAVTTGGGVKKYEPVDAVAGRPTGYKALLMVGRGITTNAAVGSQRRFVVLRKVLSTEGISLAYSKTDQTTLEVTFMGHWVDSTVRPYAIYDPS